MSKASDNVRRAVIAELSGRAAALTLQAVNLEAGEYALEGQSSRARRNRRTCHLKHMALAYQELVRDLLAKEAEGA